MQSHLPNPSPTPRGLIACTLSSTFFFSCLSIHLTPLTLAQEVIPDTTLPQNSIVTPDGNILRIEGGTQAGTNLFHSFEEFSIPTDGVVSFDNAATIDRIFSRVTGDNISNIDGLLETQGNADLFFLNPNGIVFGENAQLNVGGSFVATTAESIQFPDGGEFDADQPGALLSVTAPSGVQFGQSPGSITNRSQALPASTAPDTNSVNLPPGLTANSGGSLIFLGGDLSFEGGNATNFGGRIELGSVAGTGTVSLNPTPDGYQLGYEGVSEFGTIRLSDNAVVDASGQVATSERPEVGGNDIQVRAGQLLVENSGITSTTFNADGGVFAIAADSVFITGDVQPGQGENSSQVPPPESAGLFSQTQGDGNAGSLSIEARELNVTAGAQVSTATIAAGRGGDLNITADILSVEGVSEDGTRRSVILSQVQPLENSIATGQAGTVNLQVADIWVLNGGIIGAMTMSQGGGGNLVIDAERVTVAGVGPLFQQSRLDVASIGSDPANLGAAGNLTVDAETLRISDRAILAASSRSSQAAGNVTIRVDRLILDSGGQIQTNTLASGDGGNLRVTARESVEIFGTAPDGNTPSSILAQSIGAIQAGNAGNGGNINISTGRLTIGEGGAISAETFAVGNGGDVTVNATESIRLSGRSPAPAQLIEGATANPLLDDDNRLPSRITARAVFENPNGFGAVPPGTAGSVTLNTPQLNIENLAEVSVSADLGSDRAGDITLNVEDFRLENGGRLTSEAASGQGGNLIVTAGDVRLLENAQISTTSGQVGNRGDGGNINITTETIVGLENSDISANAFDGRGGFISITTEAILGFEDLSRSELEARFGEDLSEFVPAEEDSNLITAVSLTDPDLSGTVDIVAPDVDPTQGLVELEDRFAEAPLDRDPCRVGGEDSEFVQTGRGGLPPSPSDPVSGTELWEDTRRIPLDVMEERGTDTEAIAPQPVRLREARGWRRANGELHLFPGTASPSPGSLPSGDGCYSRKSAAEAAPESVPNAESVADLTLRGHTVLSEAEVDRVLNDYRHRRLRFAELEEARDRLTALYADRGYLTSGVYIPPQTSREGNLTLMALEGRFEAVEVAVRGRLNEGYVRDRLNVGRDDLVNTRQLLETLQLLQLDDRIDRLAAELSTGVRPGTNRLSVIVDAVAPVTARLRFDNDRSPSVGTLRQQARLQLNSLLGFGDVATLAYTRTDGSDDWSGNYTIPLNRHGGTLSAQFSTAASEIVESPFGALDIEADSRQFELTLRQPLLRSLSFPNRASGDDAPRSGSRYRELTIGLTASRRESQTSILGFDFPLSPGADADGRTRVSALRFFQDWTQQGRDRVFAARSEFSLGVDWFDATTQEDAPDSRFFLWRGRSQWLQRLDDDGDALLVLRGDVQLTPDALVPFEQIALGGRNSARGYRQDALLADNGVLGSVEVRLPLLEIPQWRGRLSVVPFVDAGLVWNSGDRDLERNGLISAGLGLRLQLGDRLRAGLDWGIPLVDLDDRGDSWQENGVYFSIESQLF